MSKYEITCVNRDMRGVIVRISGEGWSLTKYEAILGLLNEQLRLSIYVEGRLVDVGVRGNGTTYLALEPDGFPLDSLTELPRC